MNIFHVRMLSNFHPSTRERVIEQLETLLAKEWYGEVAKLGVNMEKDEFFMYLCPLITTFDLYKGLFKRLHYRDISKGFLIHGSMTLVKKAITDFTEDRSDYYINSDTIRSVIILFLNEGRHGRVIGLLEAVQERFTETDERRKQVGSDTTFEFFMDKLFVKLSPEKDSMPLKRFLTFWGERLGEKHSVVFETFCLELVTYLTCRLSDPISRKLLVDLIGQRSLLTTTAFVKGFLIDDCNSLQVNFLLYGWREAVEEGLRDEYPGGGEYLWMVIMNLFPEKFSIRYPNWDEKYRAVLEMFPTKRQLEEAWTNENAPTQLELLENLFPELQSKALLNIISKYAITWATSIASDSSQKHLALQKRERTYERLKALMDRKQYWGVIRLGSVMNDDELLEDFCPLMTTFERRKKLFWFLIHYDIQARFLVRGEMTLIREAIAEAKKDSFESYIHWRHIICAIILALNEDQHDRVIDLLNAVQEVYSDEDEQLRQANRILEFERFIHDFIEMLVPEKNSMPLKRFLLLRGEDLKENYQTIFEIFCLSLMYYMRNELDDPCSKQLLVDLIGQHSLLTATIFADAFLDYDENNNDTHLLNFVTYGWREAIAEGLKERYRIGGDVLWNHLMYTFPGEFPEVYPPPDEVLKDILACFVTKQQLEEAWAKNNAPKPLEQAEEPVTDIFPEFPSNIAPEYTITWITFTPGSSRQQLTPQASERVYEQLKILIDREEYTQIARIGNNMKDAQFSKYLCPLMTTLEHYKGLIMFLERSDMFADFLADGGSAFVEEVIGEFKDGNYVYYICDSNVRDAVILSLNRGQHDRVISLLKVVQERCTYGDKKWERSSQRNLFEGFVDILVSQLAPENDWMPFKRFLTLSGEELKEKHPLILETLCQELVHYLRCRPNDPDRQKFLTDLIGQPSLITPTAFVKGFLNSDGDDSDHGDEDGSDDSDDYDSDSEYYDDYGDSESGNGDVGDAFKIDFITYGWREAVLEVLKNEYRGVSKRLWNQVRKRFPGEFPKRYPPSAEVFEAILVKFKSKRQLEEEWAEKNAPKLSAKYERLLPELPKPLQSVIAKYAFTWLDV